MTPSLPDHPLRPGTPLWRLLRWVYRATPLDGRRRVRVIDFLRRRGWIPPGESPLTPPAATAFDLTRVLEVWPASRPLVSVLITGVGSAVSLTEVLQSLERQTLQDFEVIAVATDSALSEWSDARCRIVRRRREADDPRDIGAREALGKYVCCLDASQRLAPTYIEKALFLLEVEAYDVVSTRIDREGAGARGLARYPALTELRAGEEVSACAVFRRQLWQEAGGFGAGEPEPDTGAWRLWLRVAARGARFANLVEEPLCRALGMDLATAPSNVERVAAASGATSEVEAASARLRDAVIRVENPLVNLRPRARHLDACGTVLVALPFMVIGGADRLLSQVTAHLRRRGYRVVLVTTLAIDSTVLGDSTPDFQEATEEIYHLPRFLAPSYWRDFIFYLFETKAVDVLWVIGSAVFYDLLPELRAAYPRLKTMDLLFNAEVWVPSNRKHRERIDLNLVENTEVYEHLRRAGETDEALRLIESGVDLTAYRPGPKPADVLRELGIPDDAFIVGYSGRLAEEKRPLAFVEVASRLRDDPRVWFVMTGKGPMLREVEERARALGLGERLRILGLVPDPCRYMATYDALLLPSRLDGRPVAVMESLAMGVPVVASRVGALPELVRHGETGFLCDADAIGDFAERVAWLAGHPREHDAMRLAARRFAEERLSAKRMLAEYERAIADVLARTPALSSR
jgi:glycosyltransferase involved in cell wall biosynthesis